MIQQRRLLGIALAATIPPHATSSQNSMEQVQVQTHKLHTCSIINSSSNSSYVVHTALVYVANSMDPI